GEEMVAAMNSVGVDGAIMVSAGAIAGWACTHWKSAAFSRRTFADLVRCTRPRKLRPRLDTRSQKFGDRYADTGQRCETGVSAFALMHVGPVRKQHISRGHGGHLVLHGPLPLLPRHHAETDRRFG